MVAAGSRTARPGRRAAPGVLQERPVIGGDVTQVVVVGDHLRQLEHEPEPLRCPPEPTPSPSSQQAGRRRWCCPRPCCTGSRTAHLVLTGEAFREVQALPHLVRPHRTPDPQHRSLRHDPPLPARRRSRGSIRRRSPHLQQTGCDGSLRQPGARSPGLRRPSMTRRTDLLLRSSSEPARSTGAAHAAARTSSGPGGVDGPEVGARTDEGGDVPPAPMLEGRVGGHLDHDVGSRPGQSRRPCHPSSRPGRH